MGAMVVALVAVARTASAQNTVHGDAPYNRPPAPLTVQTRPSQRLSSSTVADDLSAKDRRFINEAARGGMMEVEWGKWAAQNGKHPEVKKFGSRMVADHSHANNELKNIAAAKGVQIPATKPSGKWKNDKDYIDMMVKGHEKDLAEFQAEAKEGSDADVKKFASRTSKIVAKHLQLAKEIQAKLK